MSSSLAGRDIYIRHTGPNGNHYVQHHRVWDADRFIASQQTAVERLNAEQPAGRPGLAKVEQITAEQYQQERKPQ